VTQEQKHYHWRAGGGPPNWLRIGKRSGVRYREKKMKISAASGVASPSSSFGKRGKALGGGVHSD